MNNIMKIKKSKDRLFFDVLSYTLITTMVIVCFLPVWLVVVGSLSDNRDIILNGYSFFIKKISLDAYELLLANPKEMLNAYKVTIICTVVGTTLHLILCTLAGYVLSRKDFVLRNAISFYLYFPTIFSGGLVSWYILCVRYLNFKEHPYMAMILLTVYGYFNTIIIRSFMSSIPESLGEAAIIDGANDFLIYLKIILPLSKPVIATIGLFSALGIWGEWYNAMLFVTDSKYYPLQYYLYIVINRQKALADLANTTLDMSMVDVPTETYKLAVTVMTTGPIVLVYPFIQKYFIKGMTVGAVKG